MLLPLQQDFYLHKLKMTEIRAVSGVIPTDLVWVFFLSCKKRNRNLFSPVLLFLSLSNFFFTTFGFSLFSTCPHFPLLFQLLFWLEVQIPLVVVLCTVPRTTFIYICSWNQDGKNSLKAMEILREESITHCALLL